MVRVFLSYAGVLPWDVMKSSMFLQAGGEIVFWDYAENREEGVILIWEAIRDIPQADYALFYWGAQVPENADFKQMFETAREKHMQRRSQNPTASFIALIRMDDTPIPDYLSDVPNFDTSEADLLRLKQFFLTRVVP